jgi:hypothetical protein
MVAGSTHSDQKVPEGSPDVKERISAVWNAYADDEFTLAKEVPRRKVPSVKPNEYSYE